MGVSLSLLALLTHKCARVGICSRGERKILFVSPSFDEVPREKLSECGYRGDMYI